MAQTVDALNGVDGIVEVSTDGGTTFTPLGGSFSSVVPSAAQRQTGEAYTIDGDTAIVLAGKRQPVDVDCKILYTDTTGEAFEVVRAAWEANTRIKVRWCPGGAVGDQQFTSQPGVITEFTYPGIDGSQAGPIMCGFKIRCNGITAAARAA